MKLLLTSSGLSTTTIKQRFLELVGKNPSDISVAFVSTAADLEENKWFVDKDKSILTGMDLKVVDVDLKNKNYVDLSILFKDIDVIFVEGGNTFYLMYWFRKSGLDKLLGELLSGGKVYVGVSAGSIMVGPSIESAGWEGGDDSSVVNLDNLDGLGLVTFCVFPHYDESQAEVINEENKHLTYELVPITNEQAVLFEDGKREIV